MNPYTLIITSEQGSTVVPLGTEAAKEWETKYKDRIKNPIIAQLRPNDVEGPWPLLQVVYPKNTEVAFKIITQGKLFTTTGVIEEIKIYCLGFKDEHKATFMMAHNNGTLSMSQEDRV